MVVKGEVSNSQSQAPADVISGESKDCNDGYV